MDKKTDFSSVENQNSNGFCYFNLPTHNFFKLKIFLLIKK